MENETQLDDLLVKYLLNEVDAAEASIVNKWLAAEEKNRQYFEELTKTWNLAALKGTAKNIDVQQEWNYFQQTIAAKEPKVLSIHEGQSLDNEAVEEKEKSRKIYRLWTSVAVAASILLVIGFGWRILFNNKEVPVAQATQPKDSLLAVVQHEVNTSTEVRRIVLEDGSVIELSPKSEVTFSKPFVDNKRDIDLIGKATFSVAKDKARPFTVYSGDLSTTALGTVFTVTAFKNARNITVRLFEGKVVVKSVDSALKKLKKDIYLLPGQELIYDKNKATAKVWSFNKKNIANKEGATILKDNPLVPENEKGNWIMFNNQSLQQVFEQLKVIYDTEIIYSKKEVQKKYFIGKFDKEESLETILKQIATLNNLTVIKENNKYIISKQ